MDFEIRWRCKLMMKLGLLEFVTPITDSNRMYIQASLLSDADLVDKQTNLVFREVTTYFFPWDYDLHSAY